MFPRLLALVVIAAATVGALGAPLPVSIEGSYAVHLFTGGALTGAFVVLLRGRLLAAAALVMLAAIGLELVQAFFLTGRSGDPRDAVAGIAGVVLVTIFIAARRALRSAA